MFKSFYETFSENSFISVLKFSICFEGFVNSYFLDDYMLLYKERSSDFFVFSYLLIYFLMLEFPLVKNFFSKSSNLFGFFFLLIFSCFFILFIKTSNLFYSITLCCSYSSDSSFFLILFSWFSFDKRFDWIFYWWLLRISWTFCLFSSIASEAWCFFFIL